MIMNFYGNCLETYVVDGISLISAEFRFMSSFAEVEIDTLEIDTASLLIRGREKRCLYAHAVVCQWASSRTRAVREGRRVSTPSAWLRF